MALSIYLYFNGDCISWKIHGIFHETYFEHLHIISWALIEIPGREPKTEIYYTHLTRHERMDYEEDEFDNTLIGYRIEVGPISGAIRRQQQRHPEYSAGMTRWRLLRGYYYILARTNSTLQPFGMTLHWPWLIGVIIWIWIGVLQLLYNWIKGGKSAQFPQTNHPLNSQTTLYRMCYSCYHYTTHLAPWQIAIAVFAPLAIIAIFGGIYLWTRISNRPRVSKYIIRKQ